MSMTFGAHRGAAPEINVTPLIDVLLVLLIIFMVILPQHYRGEQTDIPQAGTGQEVKNPEAPIIIQLNDAGEGKLPDLKINQTQVTWEGLESRLRLLYEGRADRVAFLKGDPEIDFEYVALAVDISHKAGVGRVGLLGKHD